MPCPEVLRWAAAPCGSPPRTGWLATAQDMLHSTSQAKVLPMIDCQIKQGHVCKSWGKMHIVGLWDC